MNTNQQINLDKFLATTNTDYKILPNLSNYLITENGNIWSLKRGKFLSLSLCNKTGYFRVSLTSDIGTRIPRSVHSLVAQAFLGDRPEGLEVNHISGVKTDNRVSNLEYITHAENVQHSLRMGLIKTLDNHSSATKNNKEVIRAVLEYLTTLGSKSKICEKYNLSIQYLNRVLCGKLRRDIWKDPELVELKPF